MHVKYSHCSYLLLCSLSCSLHLFFFPNSLLPALVPFPTSRVHVRQCDCFLSETSLFIIMWWPALLSIFLPWGNVWLTRLGACRWFLKCNEIKCTLFNSSQPSSAAQIYPRRSFCYSWRFITSKHLCLLCSLIRGISSWVTRLESHTLHLSFVSFSLLPGKSAYMDLFFACRTNF